MRTPDVNPYMSSQTRLNLMADSDRLPHALYRAEQVRHLDRSVIQDYGIPGITLMNRAGEVAYRILRERWPAARSLAVLAGIGNNGGDGYVIARLARKDGLAVRVGEVGEGFALLGACGCGDEQRRDHCAEQSLAGAGHSVTPTRSLRAACSRCRTPRG